jgi:hypothetical protein
MKMSEATWLLVALLVLCAAAPLSAQRLGGLRAGPSASSFYHDAGVNRGRSALPDSVRPSRWKEGAAIGAGAGIVVGFLIDGV